MATRRPSGILGIANPVFNGLSRPSYRRRQEWPLLLPEPYQIERMWIYGNASQPQTRMKSNAGTAGCSANRALDQRFVRFRPLRVCAVARPSSPRRLSFTMRLCAATASLRGDAQLHVCLPIRWSELGVIAAADIFAEQVAAIGSQSLPGALAMRVTKAPQAHAHILNAALAVPADGLPQDAKSILTDKLLGTTPPHERPRSSPRYRTRYRSALSHQRVTRCLAGVRRARCTGARPSPT